MCLVLVKVGWFFRLGGKVVLGVDFLTEFNNSGDWNGLEGCWVGKWLCYTWIWKVDFNTKGPFG